MREKLCLFILPYFGKFKNYFQIFLDSFSFNKHFDLLIITDQDMVNYTIPENVIIHKTTFDKFREFIKKKFVFSISLNNPYKLCDYKPTFGYLLEGYDFFKKYKYWGHLDSDMIIGNLDVIIPLLDENQYLKLFANGHMTIYLNNKDNNVRFMNKLNNRVIYKESFTLDKIYGFDEGGNNYNNELLSVHEIFMNEVPNQTYTNDLCFNSSTKYYKLRSTNYVEEKKCWVTDKKSHVLRFSNGRILDEKSNNYIYCHLQGRYMSIRHYDKNSFFILPNAIMNGNKLQIWLKNNISLKRIVLFFKRLAKRSIFLRHKLIKESKNENERRY